MNTTYTYIYVLYIVLTCLSQKVYFIFLFPSSFIIKPHTSGGCSSNLGADGGGHGTWKPYDLMKDWPMDQQIQL